ncbi:MAG TPA: DNA polymerase III subunit alpha [Syntrophomonadaceae bacterium]|nr:DNA polymerase III subunit alpha [Syntrophomonadaceae bacterium]
MSFVHLHTHSPYSFLDGGSSIEDLVARAAGLQMPALAITDHDNLCAAVKFSQAAAGTGLKPIQGSEITLENGFHLTLLARNNRGYASLCTLLSHAHLSHPRGQPRVAFHELEKLQDTIALSGCRRGELAVLIRAGQYQKAGQRAQEYLRLLGRDHFFIELQDNLLPGNRQLNYYLLQLAQFLDIEPLATNNVHYAGHDDFFIHDLLSCVRTLSKVQEIHAERPFNGENYLKSSLQMAELFSFCPRALENTLRLEQQCEPVFRKKVLHFPEFQVPSGNPVLHLRHLTFEGAQLRYGQIKAPVRERLEHELGVIEQMGFAGYFLLVHDLACFARCEGIRYAGRGSAADSLVAYCLYICEVDSLERRLLFERFMSPERSELPDIDIDFEARYRDRVIDYVYHKYGKDRVARVATYNTFRARSAIRDIGKALGIEESELSGIAKKLPSFSYADSIRPLLEKLPELKNSPLHEQRFQLLLDACERIAGFPRFLGTHLGGVVISDCPITLLSPLQHSALGPVITQFDKDDVEELGLVKLDLLSLRTLSAVNDTIGFIQRGGEKLDYDAIPLDDRPTYERISSGQTIGVFQLESPAQRALQARLGANQMEDIIASVALIRPGPIKGNMVEPYIARHQGREDITYLHPRLEPILGKTYGVVLFQEQVIEIATAIAGFTAGEADRLRRVMTHARSRNTMDEIGHDFIEKAVENGVEAETAALIFSGMAGYASYGFCEAHAAAFAATSFKTAYLLEHYPAEYYAAILNNQPMGYYPYNVICTEARRRGIKILPPDINLSQEDFTVGDKAIRIGLKQVKGARRAEIASILEARRSKPFSSLADLMQRSPLASDTAANFIRCGVLDSLLPNRRQLLFLLPYISGKEKQESLEFGPPVGGSQVSDFSLAEKRFWEYTLLGMDVENHFMSALRPQLRQQNIYSSQDIQNLPHNSSAVVCGLLLRPHRPPTRSGKITVFLSLEDEFGLTDVTVFENIYMRYGQLIFGPQQGPLLVKGRLQRRGQGVSITAQHISVLPPVKLQ